MLGFLGAKFAIPRRFSAKSMNIAKTLILLNRDHDFEGSAVLCFMTNHDYYFFPKQAMLWGSYLYVFSIGKASSLPQET